MQVALREQKVLWYYYWHRLFGCALAWFFWDVSFYGNKLFQSTFIKILLPGASILLTLEWTLLNSFISLVRPVLLAYALAPLTGLTAVSCNMLRSSQAVY